MDDYQEPLRSAQVPASGDYLTQAVLCALDVFDDAYDEIVDVHETNGMPDEVRVSYLVMVSNFYTIGDMAMMGVIYGSG